MLSILCKVKSPGGESEQLHLSVVAYYPVTTMEPGNIGHILRSELTVTKLPSPLLLLIVTTNISGWTTCQDSYHFHLGAKMVMDAFFY